MSKEGVHFSTSMLCRAETFMSECETQEVKMEPGRDMDTSRPPLSEETVEAVASMFRVLADPIRIRLVEALNDRGRTTGSALAASLPVTQQNVSKHLRVLYHAGIVRRHREGVWTHYELADFVGVWLIEQVGAALSAS
jgi:DNA-binding transcriptional ArsR family regulator